MILSGHLANKKKHESERMREIGLQERTKIEEEKLREDYRKQKAAGYANIDKEEQKKARNEMDN